LKTKDPLLLRAERLKAEAAELQTRSRALRELRQLQRDLDAATRGLVRVLGPYGVTGRDR